MILKDNVQDNIIIFMYTLLLTFPKKLFVYIVGLFLIKQGYLKTSGVKVNRKKICATIVIHLEYVCCLAS